MRPEDVDALEYDKIKDEQLELIKARNLLPVSLALAAGGFAAGIPRQPALLLLVPLVCFATGWYSIVNDQKVSAIHRHAATDLAPALSAAVGRSVLRWETTHRDDPHRRSRKLIQLAVNLAVYVLTGVVAVGAWIAWSQPQPFTPTRAAGAVLAGLWLPCLALLAWQFIRHADLTPDGTSHEEQYTVALREAILEAGTEAEQDPTDAKRFYLMGLRTAYALHGPPPGGQDSPRRRARTGRGVPP